MANTHQPRKFGVTSTLSGLSEGIVVNSITHNSTSETAEARDEHGQIIDIAVYGEGDEITVDGLVTTATNAVKAGSILTISETVNGSTVTKNYLVTGASKTESNTAFQTTNVTARYSPDCELWPLSAAQAGTGTGTINSDDV